MAHYLVKVSIIFLTSLTLSLPTYADISNMEEAVNIAGRQRMLSQRIVKSWLFKGQDVAIIKVSKQLDESIALFEEQLSELEDFTEKLQIKTSLKATRQLWNSFRTTALTTPNKKSAAQFIEQGEQLLTSANKVVGELESSPSGDIAKLKTINTSGRQRMLSQRIGLYYGALAWKLEDQQRYQERLSAATDLYANSLDDLMQSTYNTQEIQGILNKVSNHWKFSKAGFTLMDKQEFVPFVILTTTDSMLKRMESVTGLYAGSPELVAATP